MHAHTHTHAHTRTLALSATVDPGRCTQIQRRPGGSGGGMSASCERHERGASLHGGTTPEGGVLSGELHGAYNVEYDVGSN